MDGGYFKTDDQVPEANVAVGSSVEWTASEFVDHHKNAGWYAILLIVAVAIAAAVFVLTKDYFAPVIIMLCALVFGISAGKKPRTLEYEIDPTGIRAGAKHYEFEFFKAFTVVQEGALESIVLLPAKRWMPSISLYFAPEDADRIVDGLGAFLPYEDQAGGIFDSFVHKIRF